MGSPEDEIHEVPCARASSLPGCCGPVRVHYYLMEEKGGQECLEDDYCGPLFGSVPACSAWVSTWVQAEEDVSIHLRLKNCKRWRMKDATVVLTRSKLVRLRANGQALLHFSEVSIVVFIGDLHSARVCRSKKWFITDLSTTSQSASTGTLRSSYSEEPATRRIKRSGSRGR